MPARVGAEFYPIVPLSRESRTIRGKERGQWKGRLPGRCEGQGGGPEAVRHQELFGLEPLQGQPQAQGGGRCSGFGQVPSFAQPAQREVAARDDLDAILHLGCRKRPCRGLQEKSLATLGADCLKLPFESRPRGRLTLIANEVARLAGTILAEYAAAARKIKDTKVQPEAVKDADAVFIAVGTPSRRGDGHADLTYVHQAAEAIAREIKNYVVVVTKSTVPVGTGDAVERLLRVGDGSLDREEFGVGEHARPAAYCLACAARASASTSR